MKYLGSLFFLIFTTFGCFAQTVLVSIPPHKFFVEQIAGNTVKTILLLPPGASPHSFEPSPRQILQAAKADIWFQVGETFEETAEPALKGNNPKMKIVSLQQGLDLISYKDEEGDHRCNHQHCYDPHTWLSPRLAKKQAALIAKTLEEQYPEKRQFYQKNLQIFLKKLDQLNLDIVHILAPLKNRWIMVSHPAYAYFCRDYHLHQLPVEFEGREPSPKQVTKILDLARLHKILTVFIQEQQSSKGARLIAEQIGAKVISLDPLAEDYLDNMRFIARSFAQ